MIIESFPCGPFSTNAIIVGCEDSKKAILVDPAQSSCKIFRKLLIKHQMTPVGIYLTHSHWDHIADLKTCQEAFLIPTYVHEFDKENILNPGADGLPLMFDIPSATIDGFLTDKQKCQLGSITFNVIHTPGHSPGSVVFYFPKESILISGDTLFKGSIGNLSFPTSDSAKMWESLKKLSSLPEDTKVFPGHGDTTTLKDEPWLDRASQIFG